MRLLGCLRIYMCPSSLANVMAQILHRNLRARGTAFRRESLGQDRLLLQPRQKQGREAPTADTRQVWIRSQWSPQPRRYTGRWCYITSWSTLGPRCAAKMWRISIISICFWNDLQWRTIWFEYIKRKSNLTPVNVTRKFECVLYCCSIIGVPKLWRSYGPEGALV